MTDSPDPAVFESSFDSDTSPAIQTAFPKVIVMVYGGVDLEQTLHSLAHQNRLRYPHLESTVLDDGRVAGLSEAASEHHGDVAVLRSLYTSDSVQGINAGVRHAIGAACDYVLLLAAEVEPDPAMVAEMVDVAESNPTIGCLGPKALRADERDRLLSAGGELRFGRGLMAERGAGELDMGRYDEIEDVDCLGGAALLVRRAALERVGLFDPSYGSEAWDVDWCTRARRVGYRCCYVPRSMVWCPVPESDSPSPSQAYESGRGCAIFTRRYATGGDWVRFWVALLSSLPTSYVSELMGGRQGAVPARWRGVRDGLGMSLDEPPDL